MTATSCCPRRLSTCRTIAVTIIVSPPSVRLPTASCCHLQENNEQYIAYERKHFEGRLKVHQLPSIQPRTPSLSCQCSSTERHQPDNHQPSPSSICPACLSTFSSILSHNIFICEQSITSGFSLWVDSWNVMNQ